MEESALRGEIDEGMKDDEEKEKMADWWWRGGDYGR